MRKSLDSRLSEFENIRHLDINGDEYWSARELMPLLGYVTWENFKEAISRAQTSARTNGITVELLFRDATKQYNRKNRWGGLTTYEKEDFELSRYACYLIAQNGDPSKEAIAGAQAYFVLQTRKQEVFEQLGSDDQRLLLRNEVIDNNKRLNSAAKQHGVTNYGSFHHAGYAGLYGGLSVKQVENRKKLGKDKLLDRADTTELAANLFRITQTENVLANEVIDGVMRGQRGSESVHKEIGKRVRQTIIDNKSTLPENLPPAKEHIKQLEKRAKQKKLPGSRSSQKALEESE
jgi:DNA-damage-inducible protein D